MTTFTLRIVHESDAETGVPVEYVYTGDEGMLEGDLTLAESLDNAEVQVGDIWIGIGGTFLGATSRSSLPFPSIPGDNGGAYRARLTRTRGGVPETVLDGAVPVVDLGFDRPDRNWTVRLAAVASEDFWARLEAVRLIDLPDAVYAALTYSDLRYVYRADLRYAAAQSTRYFTSDADYPFDGPERVRWYDLFNLVYLVVTGAAGGVTLTRQSPGGPYLPPWPYTVRYTSGGVVQSLTRTPFPVIFSYDGYRPTADGEPTEYTRTNLTLPAWNGKELVERVLALTGWGLSVRYADYPSTDLVATFLPAGQVLPDASTLPEIDERAAESGYTEKGAPGLSGGFAVRHASALRSTTPPVQMPVRLLENSNYQGRGTFPAPPPVGAVLAQRPWEFTVPKKRDDEPEPTAETSEETGWNLPMIAHPVANTFGLPASVITPVSGYSERLIYGLPVIDTGLSDVLLGSLVEVAGEPYLAYGRQSLAAARPADEPVLTHDVGARTAYAARGASNVPTEVCTGDFYLQGIEIGVGVPSQGVSLGGDAYLVTERTTNLTDDATALGLSRPRTNTTTAAALCGPTGTVGDLQLRYEYTGDIPSGDLDRVLISTWRPPPLAQGGFVQYDHEWRVGSEAWGTHTPERVFATAHLVPDVTEFATYQVRVRIVGDDGPGLWVESAPVRVDEDSIANGSPT